MVNDVRVMILPSSDRRNSHSSQSLGSLSMPWNMGGIATW